MANKVTLKVFVDQERNKVLYAEAEKDFVEALFSFLTLPLGTIARLCAYKYSNIEAVRFGCISSLNRSVSDLDEKYLCSNRCKEMLLEPRNSMEAYCHKLKLNIYDEPFWYYISGTRKCSNCVSIFRNQKCLCGELMNVGPVFPSDLISIENGFVKETATFIIHDDLSVMPNDLVKSLGLLQMNGINDTADIERKTLLISKKEVIDLLKLSILSKIPLTDFVFKKEQFIGDSNPTFLSENRIGQSLLPPEEGKQMLMKLLVRKSTRNILFAIAEEDFADFLFSFLTFPLGGVLHMLEGFSSLSCIDSLYKSMTELSPERCLRSQELKKMLSEPPIFPTFEVKNQILPIKTTIFTRKSSSMRLEFVDPKSSLSGGFTRGPLTIIVTDDLIVTPNFII